MSTPVRDERPLSTRTRIVRMAGGGVWLIYLANPVLELLGRAEGWRQMAGLVATVLFVVTYLADLQSRYGFHIGVSGDPDVARRWGFLAVMLGCAAAAVPGARDEALTYLVFVAAAAMGTLPLAHGIAVVAVLFAGAELSGWLVPGWSTDGSGLAIFLAGMAVFGFRMAFVRRQQLVDAERALGERALQEERARIATDLHDILGHSLTVIAVKSELAARLVDVDPARAQGELDELQRLARDALGDVRTTTLGIRGVSLPGEIASARSALESAGIEADLPTVADDVPGPARELFAWTIREAVTNIVRHSGANRCDITMSADRVVITDDGVGASGSPPDGHGLDGLRRRTRRAGARLATGPGPGGSGFSVSVEFASERADG